MLAIVPDGVRIAAETIDRPSIVEARSRPVVCYAGHLYAWKGVDILLRALADVPEVDATIVGGHDKEPDLDRMRDVDQALLDRAAHPRPVVVLLAEVAVPRIGVRIEVDDGDRSLGPCGA